MWNCDADMAEDAKLTEGDMHLAHTPISTPSSAQARRSRSALGTIVLPDRGSGAGRKGGNSLIVI